MGGDQNSKSYKSNLDPIQNHTSFFQWPYLIIHPLSKLSLHKWSCSGTLWEHLITEGQLWLKVFIQRGEYRPVIEVQIVGAYQNS